MPDSPWPPPNPPAAPDQPAGAGQLAPPRLGWYEASDGQWYASATAPAPGWWMASDLRWYPPTSHTEPWRGSRWGLGDVWWAALAIIVSSIVVGGVVVAAGADENDFTSNAYLIAALIAPNILGFAVVPWLATKRKGLKSLADDFGLTGRLRDVAIGIGIGIGGMIAAGLASTAIDSLLGADEQTSNIPVDALEGAGEIVVFALVVAAITPIIEELFFRGLVYRSMLKRGRSVRRSIIVTTAIFTVPHLTAATSGIAVVSLAAAIFVLGLAFNLAAHLTGNRLLAPIVAHMVVNGAAVLALALA